MRWLTDALKCVYINMMYLSLYVYGQSAKGPTPTTNREAQTATSLIMPLSYADKFPIKPFVLAYGVVSEPCPTSLFI